MTIADSIKNILLLKNNNNKNKINENNNNNNNYSIDNEYNDDDVLICKHKIYSKNEEIPPPPSSTTDSNTKNNNYLNKYLHQPTNQLCRENVEKTFKEDPILQFIIKEMMTLGCLPPIITCEPCDSFDALGSFSPKKGVVICDNMQTFPLNIRNTIVHEFVHAYDMCKNKLNPFNCEHLACTEIRAANLSGDCKWQLEALKKNFGVFNHQAECTKRRAIGSLQSNPNCKDVAEMAVNKVWEKCNKDYYPFSNIPRI
ncbi:hypothetical protein RB653_006697 [Dictyostelium firmibasis]|uniref:Mitochondrial inner membrane protease ATP23 n=1 Tax=Dictyostelium firmibasis TaxID=79012 RepID=A0AAN7TM75_9MYCE